jgi:ABC-type sugar transport system ATPase subunit
MSNLILVIGGTSSGKSPFVKNFIKEKNCLVFDFQNEYGEFNKYKERTADILTNDITAPRARIYCRPEEFIEIIKRRKNTNVVWEEATGFFSGRIGKELVQVILSKAHTGNNFIFIFHSVQRIPKAIVEFANYVILFRTGDVVQDVKAKIPAILPAFIEVQKNKTQGFHKIIKVQ